MATHAHANHDDASPDNAATQDPHAGTGPGGHAVALDPALGQAALQRLKRIEGQVRGLQRMVEDERYCADILMQIASVHEALRGVGKLLMRNHLEHCVTDALRSGDRLEAERAYGEVLDLMYKHAR